MKTEQKNNCVFRNSKAFTLVETLVVVLIIGILAAVALPEYNTSTQMARASEIGPNVKALEQALNIYLEEKGFPSSSVIFLGEGQNTKPLVGTQTIEASKYYEYGAKCELSECTITAIKKKKGETVVEVKFTRSSGQNKWTKQCTYNNSVDRYSEAICRYLESTKVVASKHAAS